MRPIPFSRPRRVCASARPWQKFHTIVSFGNFIDETSAQADLILPDHAPLESWLDSMPESGSMQTVVNLAPPAVLPLHDTRSMPDVLLGVAHQLGGEVAKALPCGYVRRHAARGVRSPPDPRRLCRCQD